MVAKIKGAMKMTYLDRRAAENCRELHTSVGGKVPCRPNLNKET
jgi:hypothetical protein